ncbi:spheroidene monooxygenase [Roseovarius ramblicola]|uniref:Spheroidene monooxygenase n=1 Tax=Roseovarius ramblicola TaxID=2022336 RepID=A0ABV5I466_9RHOB
MCSRSVTGSPPTQRIRSGPIQTVSLSFFRFGSVRDRLWALAMMGLARRGLAATPGIGFWKLCGSGTGEGFTPRPNTAVYAILATWDRRDTARIQTGYSPVFSRYHARARESWTVFLHPVSARGTWSGTAPFAAEPDPGTGPLAALTRATVRPRAALSFWNRVPNISAMIGDDPNVAFKIGIGEVPLLHQVTFSIWPSAGAMAQFARADGPHARAIRAVRTGDWFSEELYARFRVTGTRGTWLGTNPLESLKESA